MLLVFLLLGPAGLAVARRRKELPIDREPGEAGTQQRAKASGEQSLPTTKKRNAVTTRWKERVTSLFLWPVDTVVVGVLADVDGHSVEWEVAVASCRPRLSGRAYRGWTCRALHFNLNPCSVRRLNSLSLYDPPPCCLVTQCAQILQFLPTQGNDMRTEDS